MVASMWSDIIYLGAVTETVVSGEVIKNVTWRKIFGDKLSIRSKEFYEARLVGLKPEIAFEVYTSEYQDEIKLRYNNKDYEIIRTYGDDEKVQLICTRALNG